MDKGDLEDGGGDSLVSILGLKSMTGEQIPAVSSPRDGEDVSITSGQPKHCRIVGLGGIGESLLLVSLCGLCTLLTGLSLSAIATNGAMKGGGPYYLIDRALGPEVGVSIGLCFFLGNAVAGALYVLGAIETFLKALPSAGIFTAGVTGLSLESFKDNWNSHYQNTNSAGIPDAEGNVQWNFHDLVGLFSPAVTGIMAGSNRSASLKDTQRFIPIGTLVATLTTTGLYLVFVLLFGVVATRDKLLTDSLTGAPRLLAAISNDDVLPVLNYFKVADGSEPYMATLFTAFVCMDCVIIGNLDIITPTVTMFFLLCYSGVSLSCFLLDLLDAPSWRPRWKFHHWSLSLLGASLCIVNMFLISCLRSLGASQVHPKNWYPIPLVFCRPWGKLPENVPCHPKLADFVSCMKKKGRGMSIFINILDGDYHERAEDAKAACKQLDTYINYKNCEGVAEIVVAPNMTEGFRGVVQTMGLGNLKPNIVVKRYPEIWRRENLQEIPARFVGIINDCIVANKAVVIVKGLDEWPNEY
ncbi:hypothetical protein V6N13_036895 [Hibiscus sabdariffa]